VKVVDLDVLSVVQKVGVMAELMVVKWAAMLVE
jgi:hypothetical protein